jgi:hypothetical protein
MMFQILYNLCKGEMVIKDPIKWLDPIWYSLDSAYFTHSNISKLELFIEIC